MTLHKQHNNNITFFIVYSLHCASFPLQVDLTRALFISFLSSKCFYIYLLPLSRIFSKHIFHILILIFLQNQKCLIHKSHFVYFKLVVIPSVARIIVCFVAILLEREVIVIVKIVSTQLFVLC